MRLRRRGKNLLEWFSCCFRFRFHRDKTDQRPRIVQANNFTFNRAFKYANNSISTSKYNPITFIPKNLFEQFQRVANLYFLFLLCLQLTPVISSLSPITTILPLGLVLLITAIKEACDDIQRCKSDREVNRRMSWVLNNKRLVQQPWNTIKPGDIIQLRNDEFVTADIFIVSTSEASGLCYIETLELDGETNLKVKQALEVTSSLYDNVDLLCAFDGTIECDPPNNNLSKFDGNLHYGDASYLINNDNILLRGCRLRNTHWCYGIVIYAGNDTKLMRNSGKPCFKRTAIDKILNKLMWRIFAFLAIICCIAMFGCILFEGLLGYSFQEYLPWQSFIIGGRTGGAIITGLLQFWSYVIVLNTVVPISLYVSIELTRVFQSKWIDWDLNMYDTVDNIAAVSRTTTLNEELGRIKYIFTDKTGTLTKNAMTFVQCSINGVVYGTYGSDTHPHKHKKFTNDNPDPSTDKSFQWHDKKLPTAIENNDPDVMDFLINMAICHTVMVENELEIDNLRYQAQSPDESALVQAARYFGIVYLSRTSHSITVSIKGHKVVYPVLNILDFNNDRKRMSIIFRDPSSNKIKLYCKGADNKIQERLDKASQASWPATEECLNNFANEGLRTLCFASRVIEENEYAEWKAHYDIAAASIEDRELKLAAVYEQIEHGLTLSGASAIEDELQDDVPLTIAKLLNARMKVWVLTGDKMETAINIGLSCRLLSNDMDLQIVEEEGLTDVIEKMRSVKDYMEAKLRQMYDICEEIIWDWEWVEEKLGDAVNKPRDTTFGGFALAIGGQSLLHAVDPAAEHLFVDVASMCKSVICCRVTPLQKSSVVELIRKHKKVTTLAIGDGANDVSMIQRAHIGVGISGKEGRQAVLASDFSIGQFRFLQHLLLVHGRWSYFRICKFLDYFFYKNFAFTLCNLWYAFLCGFSATPLFDPFFIATYNVFFTSLPVLALGVLDQDINAANSLRFPRLYTPGHKDEFFNFRTFCISVFRGIVNSLVIFWVPYFCYRDSTMSNGQDIMGIQAFGFVVAMILTIVVNLQIALDTFYWTAINHFFIWGTIVFCFLIHYTMYSTILWAIFNIGYYYVGVARMGLGDPKFWLTACLTCAICMMPVYTGRLYNRIFRPTLTDEARYKQTYGMNIPLREPKWLGKRLKIHRRWFRSGYAFSHSEGFGNLINAGLMMKRVFTVRDRSNKNAQGSSSQSVNLINQSGRAQLITGSYSSPQRTDDILLSAETGVSRTGGSEAPIRSTGAKAGVSADVGSSRHLNEKRDNDGSDEGARLTPATQVKGESSGEAEMTFSAKRSLFSKNERITRNI